MEWFVLLWLSLVFIGLFESKVLIFNIILSIFIVRYATYYGIVWLVVLGYIIIIIQIKIIYSMGGIKNVDTISRRERN